MNGRNSSYLAALLAVTALSPVDADVVYIKGRGKLEGKVTQDPDAADHIIVKTRFGDVRLRSSQVERIESSEAPAESVKEVAKKFSNTAEDQFKFATWCRENGHGVEATKALERVIAIEPDHAEARKLLGYSYVDGKWMTRDEEMEAQGYVKYRGRYILPQQKEVLEQSEEASEARKEHYRQLRFAERLLASPEKERQRKGMDILQSLKDPLAVEPIVEVFWKRDEPAYRGVAVEALGGIEGPESTDALLRAALEDPTRDNRGAAVDILVSRKSPELIGKTLPYLQDNENDKVARSAVLLGALKDPSAIGPLVEALETKHRYVHNPTPQEIADAISNKKYVINRTEILPDGTMVQRSRPRITPIRGFVGDAKVIEETKKNPDVLRALVEITGQDFGYNKEAWESWLTEEHQRKAKQP